MSRLKTSLAVIPLMALSISSTRCGDNASPTTPSGPSNTLSVASASPATGPTVGANIVRLSGSAFQTGAHVTVDSQDVPATVQNANIVVITMPPHEAGVVDIVVTNPSGESARLTRGYTYQFIPPPVISDVRPLAGATIGGTPVTITGSGFRPGATVSIGGAVAFAFVQSSTTIFVTTISHAPGTVPVSVMNTDSQSATSEQNFTFADVSTFDFNGDWDGSAYAPNIPEHVLFRLKVRDNVVVSVTCLRDEEIVLSPAPAVTNGRFRYEGPGGATMTGTILSPDYAEGTIDIAPCRNGGWDALKR